MKSQSYAGCLFLVAIQFAPSQIVVELLATAEESLEQETRGANLLSVQSLVQDAIGVRASCRRRR